MFEKLIKNAGKRWHRVEIWRDCLCYDVNTNVPLNEQITNVKRMRNVLIKYT